MSNALHPALLPAGLTDLLPPDAEHEAASVAAMMAVFASHGYERVKPPLLEFEDSLLAGAGAAMGDQVFRVMDPDTRRMLGLRADMTPQVARIAATRLAHTPRPLRLSYAGQCLRLLAQAPAPDRQVAQAGIELIGVDSPAADAETVLVAAEALAAVGLTQVSMDLTLPALAPMLIDGVADRNALAHALDRKDAAAVRNLAGPLAPLLGALLDVAGPAPGALAALGKLHLPPAAAALCDRLRAVVHAIAAQAPALRLTLDPIEFRGFGYHTGVCVTVYAPQSRQPLGQGGAYLSGAEPATGITLYPDAVLRAAKPGPGCTRVFVPAGTPQAAAAALRREGFATIAALGNHDPAHLRCTHIIRDGRAVPLATSPGEPPWPT